MNRPGDASLHDHARMVFGMFVVATVASCGYCIVMGQFNGDFFPYPVYMSILELLKLLVICLLPYGVTWRLAAIIDRLPPARTFKPHENALTIFVFGALAAHIAATLLFGVGVLDSQVYTAPPQIAPFIQVLNRLDPFYLGAFFILATRKRIATDFLAIALMIGTGILRAGLGAFIYVLIVLLIKYRVELLRLFRSVPWLVISGALALPTIISALYDLRGRLRGDPMYEYSVAEMVLGRFVGRLSSYSNVAFIDQYKESFAWSAKALEPLFYLKQGLVTLLGASASPAITPERLLIANNRAYEGYSTFMTGVPGNLMIAWYVSPQIALLNLGIILGCIVGTLWLSRYLGGYVARTFGIAMIVYPLTSGVANEFTSLLFNTLLFVIFSMVFAQRNRMDVLDYGT